ncbi:hypothetical protein [Nitrospina watsonii]|uniref:Decaheme cytochrome c n=1 Tax=Nitrospina watsonii TaxID=1323948 RepID=A0ABN8VZU2_9BACT|nr:hypothetical protein [Nitrospina watsonii]CAI2719307.1 Putative Decaheme cytochrome c [Nitrospina watsonii]
MKFFKQALGSVACLLLLGLGLIPSLQAQIENTPGSHNSQPKKQPDLGFSPSVPGGHLFGSEPEDPTPEEETLQSETPVPPPQSGETTSPMTAPPEPYRSEPIAPQPFTPDPFAPEPFAPEPEPQPFLGKPKTETAEPEPHSTEPEPTVTFEKKMVLIPPIASGIPLSADDFRDPFFLIRNKRESAQEVLKPGTTLDGIRFNSYADGNGFIENFYRDSNFRLRDVFGKIELVNIEGGCLTCHRGIEEISENHRFDCTTCHQGSERGRTPEQAHTGMIPNPSALEHAPNACGKCHAEQVEQVQNSLMANPRGMVEMTRYAWGHSPFNTSKGGKDAKPWTFEDSGHRADDFLKKKCLRCHVQSNAPHRAGDYRATGCAACHMIYTNDGLTLSRDRAIQKVQKADIRKNGSRFAYRNGSTPLKNRRGYPLVHKFTVAVPSVQCEHCHNNNGVGNEYEGLFGKPARPMTSHDDVLADQPVLHGRQHDFLIPDIHREKGMHCIDCHSAKEMKADASRNPTMHSAVNVRCQTCHGTHHKPPEGYQLVEADERAQKLLKSNQLNPNLMTKVALGDVVMTDDQGDPLPHIKQDRDQWVLFSKVTGKKHVIPLLKELKSIPLAHRITEHLIKVECAACHARWSANEWGLHAIREPELDVGKWSDWNFADPVLQQRFRTPSLLQSEQESEDDASQTESSDPGMLDWTRAKQKPQGIDGPWSPGVWVNLITESGWSEPMLGANRRGRVIVVQPRYQYFITDLSQSDALRNQAEVPVTQDGKPGLVWTPHTPHTIRPTARKCESCHQNSVATGLGESQLHKVEDAGRFLNELKSTNRVLPEFQIKQTVTPKGRALQTVVPDADFLDRKLIDSLNRQTDRYRGWYYTDLKTRGLGRLLVREVFPYDSRHELNEKKFGQPAGDEDLVLYYDFNDNRVKSEQRLHPAQDLFTPQPGPGADDIEPVAPPAESMPFFPFGSEPTPEFTPEPETNPLGIIPPPIE